MPIPPLVEYGIELSGPTKNRPDGRNNLPSVRGVGGGMIGVYFFDETIGQPIWWSGTEWVSINGTPI